VGTFTSKEEGALFNCQSSVRCVEMVAASVVDPPVEGSAEVEQFNMEMCDAWQRLFSSLSSHLLLEIYARNLAQSLRMPSLYDLFGDVRAILSLLRLFTPGRFVTRCAMHYRTVQEDPLSFHSGHTACLPHTTQLGGGCNEIGQSNFLLRCPLIL